MSQRLVRNGIRIAVLSIMTAGGLAQVSQAQGVPVAKISTEGSTIKFNVKASIKVAGTFDKWDATLTFTSTDVTSGVLDIKIQAASVNCGSGVVDKTMKGKDYFDVEHNPLITFHSTKITQTGPNTFDVLGDYMMRGVTKPQTLSLTLDGTKGSGTGQVKGIMYFDRKDYGMTKNIPFVTVADRIEVDNDLKVTRVSGPPLVFKQ